MANLDIGFIGFGELASTFAADLVKTGNVSIAACDLLFVTPSSQPLQSAEALGVTVMQSIRQVCQSADLIICAVTAANALDVAKSAASAMRPGGIFFDVNSVSPQTKQQAAAAFEHGATYVEGAVMAPVGGVGARVHILAGGAAAASVAGLLNPKGFNIEVFAAAIGPASAAKLCRSIVIKGMEALLSEAAEAARHWGVIEAVLSSLRNSPPSLNPEYTLERVARHGVRRADELRQAAEMVAALQIDPALCQAAADRQLAVHGDALRASTPSF